MRDGATTASPLAGASRDHGGDLAVAVARYGGASEDWLDLSTGVNPIAYPLPAIEHSAWTRLPSADREASLLAAARHAYRAAPDAMLVAAAGAQALIQTTSWVAPPGPVAVVAPTYNEHAGAMRDVGRAVEEIADPDQSDAPTLILVNPNNPDGRRWSPDAVRVEAARRRLLVVDESFADATPELSAATIAGAENLFILRSFGKFYGLAGLRLGFAIGGQAMIAAIRRRLGPWAVSGPAIEIGCAALADHDWAAATRARLAHDADRLDRIAVAAGWRVCGGATLFRLYETPDAFAARDQLARARIWTRAFPYSRTWLRLGSPGDDESWSRLAAALAAQ